MDEKEKVLTFLGANHYYFIKIFL